MRADDLDLRGQVCSLGREYGRSADQRPEQGKGEERRVTPCRHGGEHYEALGSL
jgi:hypothetical protein